MRGDYYQNHLMWKILAKPKKGQLTLKREGQPLKREGHSERDDHHLKGTILLGANKSGNP